jgi:hypothetical protein
MSRLRRFGILVALGGIAIAALEAGDQLSMPGVHSVISPAQAVVGRPLTPVSVAGVARRTVRRCAAGVYRC